MRRAFAATALGVALACTATVAVLHNSSQKKERAIKPGDTEQNPIDLVAQRVSLHGEYEGLGGNRSGPAHQEIAAQIAQIDRDMTDIAGIYKWSGIDRQTGKDLGAAEVEETRLARLIQTYGDKFVRVKINGGPSNDGTSDNVHVFLLKGAFVDDQSPVAEIFESKPGAVFGSSMASVGTGKGKGTSFTADFIRDFLKHARERFKRPDKTPGNTPGTNTTVTPA